MAQTFRAIYSGIAFAANKPMAVMTNASASEVIKIRRVILNNPQLTAVTGVAALLELRKYGPVATINTPVAATTFSMDNTNTAPAALTVNSGATITGGTLIATPARVFWSTDEPSISTGTNDELQCFLPLNYMYEWLPHSDVQPLTLRNAEQLMVFNNSSAAVGLLDVYIDFTKE